MMSLGTHGCREVSGFAGQSVRRAAVTALRDEVSGYRKLKVSWDTYAGQPICDAALRFANALLGKLYRLPDIPLPTVAPISTGLKLTWKREGRETYFEADDETTLCRHVGPLLKRTYGEDPTYNVKNAVELLKQLHSQGML